MNFEIKLDFGEDWDEGRSYETWCWKGAGGEGREYERFKKKEF